ncbi:carbamoyltransferase HypF [Methylacidiphilum caldifontis]|uniref:carbamoyltransferase HypF n=1 Tax=Methylacidiphilum caldifontis TaxID=2795386 RepID=UPI001A8C44D8|nr:carbamoyltransferase HypF [Methylacidiphilum caldifontis]QSR88414.1 carbamoyltransferase HypF [Methylacidiphilum caldifontis]
MDTKDRSFSAWHLHLRGKVQGVGFRPFVYRLAKEKKLGGWVSNDTDGVHIYVEGEKEKLQDFYLFVITHYPPIALVTESSYQEVPVQGYKDFFIKESLKEGSSSVLLLPDLDVCEQCIQELHCPTDRRYGYPFITCTQCGPRYSIIFALPYDRQRTSMEPFKMCEDCQREYQNPLDRRFFSQTNSCKKCGIELSLSDNLKTNFSYGEQTINQAAEAILKGEIVAVKGIGGFLLIADAGNEQTLKRLREKKKRPHKPFALMFLDIQSVKKEVELSDEDQKLLNSRSKPIVILDRKKGNHSLVSQLVAPGQDTLGVMLAYSPLHILLLEHVGKPVVATSANISGSPILSMDQEIYTRLGHLVDKVLSHNRQIIVAQDDSVVISSPFYKQPIFLRRSRSYAPFYAHENLRLDKKISLLALGADQKGCFSLCHEGNIYVSQYLGSLQNFESEENYKKQLNYYFLLFNLDLNSLAIDLHPAYRSTEIGLSLAAERKITPFYVQHHKAHFWAVLAENDLIYDLEPILGVIWDGTGFGEDGAIWGGEFFLYQNGKMNRIKHFSYYPLLLGDKTIKEPRLSALGILWKVGKESLLKEKFSSSEWHTYLKLLNLKHYFLCSSVGRLFDCVCSMLGGYDLSTFEGQAAMEVQKLATRYAKSFGSLDCLPWERFAFIKKLIRTQPQISLNDFFVWFTEAVNNHWPKEQLAFGFHYWLCWIIIQIASAFCVKKIAVSGGVFQNALLVDLLRFFCTKDFELYFHRQLSPNDENISLGQLIALAHEKKFLQRNYKNT